MFSKTIITIQSTASRRKDSETLSKPQSEINSEDENSRSCRQLSTDWDTLSYCWVCGRSPVESIRQAVLSYRQLYVVVMLARDRPPVNCSGLAVDSHLLFLTDWACACLCTFLAIESSKISSTLSRSLFMDVRHPKYQQSPSWLTYHESFVEIGLHTINKLISPFMTSHGSLPRAHSPPYLWRTLMKLRDALNFSTEMVFVIMSARFFFVLIFTKSIFSTTTQLRTCDTSHQYALFAWSLARCITLWVSQ